ncbi:MAG: Mov34/MPN/PAD-1 family protein [Candidatus Thermoplasmatota archaeon]|nr:Mov34/MPN/PAD-1 family protein [Candidatus Thermoplasmatota archaeon]
MLFFKKRNRGNANNRLVSWKITSNCLKLICECAKSEYPNEFGGLLRVDSEKKTTINEIVLLPGTISGDAHAIFRMHMLPIDFSIVGTVHSHPSHSAKPSSADLQLFRKHGKVHIICANPYDSGSWKAYNYNGEDLAMEVV